MAGGDLDKPESGAEEFARLSREVRAHENAAKTVLVGESDALKALYESAIESEMEILRLRYASGPPPTEGSVEAEPDWMPALQASHLVQELLDVDPDQSAEALTRWAATEDVASRFRLRRYWSSDDPDDLADTRNGLVKDRFWHRFAQKGENDVADWSAGDFSVTWYANRERHHVSLSGVQFDANGIRRTAPPLPAQDDEDGQGEHSEAGKGDNNDGGLPDVDFEHLKLWFAAFTAAYGQGSEPLAIASARGAFPRHYVRRQWVRDLRGRLEKGRPRKNKEN